MMQSRFPYREPSRVIRPPLQNYWVAAHDLRADANQAARDGDNARAAALTIRANAFAATARRIAMSIELKGIRDGRKDENKLD